MGDPPRNVRRKLSTLAQRLSATAVALAGNLWEVNNPNRLIIFDDCFPNLLSAFRVAEYNAYLRHFPDTEVYSSAITVTGGKDFATLRKEYARVYPDLVKGIRPFHHRRRFYGGLAYTVFLNNAFPYINVVEKHKLPFVFTLYPGGGFQLDDPESDAKLQRVCSSPMLRKIITTQRITQKYLISKQFLDPDKIEFIYGGVLPVEHYAQVALPRKRKGIDKDHFDLCFVANRYSPRGVDKGYDTFIEVAHRLSRQRSDVRFHIVGNFNESDIDVSAVADRITFHGNRFTDWFPQFYANMDLIISPNVPFMLAPGAFDGFPTGCCIEASASGVAMVCSDVLNLDVEYRPSEDLVLTPPDPAAVQGAVTNLLDHPDELYRIADNGRGATLRIYNIEAQIGPRLKVFERLIKHGSGTDA